MRMTAKLLIFVSVILIVGAEQADWEIPLLKQSLLSVGQIDEDYEITKQIIYTTKDNKVFVSKTAPDHFVRKINPNAEKNQQIPELAKVEQKLPPSSQKNQPESPHKAQLPQIKKDGKSDENSKIQEKQKEISKLIEAYKPQLIAQEQKETTEQKLQDKQKDKQTEIQIEKEKAKDSILPSSSAYIHMNKQTGLKQIKIAEMSIPIHSAYNYLPQINSNYCITDQIHIKPDHKFSITKNASEFITHLENKAKDAQKKIKVQSQKVKEKQPTKNQQLKKVEETYLRVEPQQQNTVKQASDKIPQPRKIDLQAIFKSNAQKQIQIHQIFSTTEQISQYSATQSIYPHKSNKFEKKNINFEEKARARRTKQKTLIQKIPELLNIFNQPPRQQHPKQQPQNAASSRQNQDRVNNNHIENMLTPNLQTNDQIKPIRQTKQDSDNVKLILSVVLVALGILILCALNKKQHTQNSISIQSSPSGTSLAAEDQEEDLVKKEQDSTKVDESSKINDASQIDEESALTQPSASKSQIKKVQMVDIFDS